MFYLIIIIRYKKICFKVLLLLILWKNIYLINLLLIKLFIFIINNLKLCNLNKI